ncbi:adenosylcobinamide-GDP ribazoletransferase [Heliorestis acidaminivorans]|uniref:Adenosylcobinamide-GDP ribazoletransferase n=1 Tax=Heliorestis acidaminivorans TaxID=553427 RepID=A0A6I0F5C0_9FIRM|nr:adenosylcobinamide-GDP ribazoletransferase [Heliorestis acidaminivorans]KAB2954192.1 adenosylcobinamide-GDP ribazoletransferase [Heliorestis acidaminivorans]
MVQRFFMALSFFTRLPVPSIAFNEQEFGKSLVYIPLVGLILGLILAVTAFFLSYLAPFTLLIPLLIAFQVYLTGALNLDGFMDTFDGIFSGRKAEQILEIMRDSRVGAHAVISVTLLFLLKIGAFASFYPLEITSNGAFMGAWNYLNGFYGSLEAFILTLLWLPMMGRWAITFALYHFPYARPEGLASLFHRHRPKKPVAKTTAFTAFVMMVTAGFMGLFILLLTALFVYFWARQLTSLLGGLTGDIYGAICETVEVFALILLVLCLQWPFWEVLS